MTSSPRKSLSSASGGCYSESVFFKLLLLFILMTKNTFIYSLFSFPISILMQFDIIQGHFCKLNDIAKSV